MAEKLGKYPQQIGQCTVEPVLGGASIVLLAHLHNHRDHAAMKEVEHACSQGCGTMLRGPQFFAAVTACDACRDKAQKAERMERAKSYWEHICPPSFRETTKEHAGFPRAQYEATKDWAGGDSLFFFGPSGKGKSRLAMLLLKRCLVRANMRVGVLWPEQLKAAKHLREPMQWVEQWGRYDVLLMDDAVLAAANDVRCTDAFKDLLDFRMRHKRTNIITSQIGGDDVKEQLAKFDKDTKADRELVAALWRRLRETCRVISFGEGAPVGAAASAKSADDGEPF
jgi:DNA replication protein DnaC